MLCREAGSPHSLPA